MATQTSARPGPLLIALPRRLLGCERRRQLAHRRTMCEKAGGRC
jgi:hypothetical protein